VKERMKLNVPNERERRIASDGGGAIIFSERSCNSNGSSSSRRSG
jgi:hypothetical protein